MNSRPRLNGLRGAGLLAGAVYCLTRGLGYLPIAGDVPEKLPGGLQLLATALSIEVWGGIWLCIGIVCALRAFSPNDALAWGLLVGIMAAWGAAYALGWGLSLLVSPGSREWLSALTYLGPAAIIAALSARTARRDDAQ
ncbi:hypothetical protein D9V30_08400 [Mycetocola reblochoni]|uniref:Integral membrane protein n=2 Tax=Mycetocola reblochoni TaxID=331618 RepID=A0A1R4JQF1_9MICO|nr:hypothetical protein [Mycetocola reblochoni]RLP69317.1 hypothetical protein D9V30_08400 [Mycetocola reblochoni]SJN34229.1 hypothetical protein FM119_08850 [Mycetocola reblochoni REB411]